MFDILIVTYFIYRDVSKLSNYFFVNLFTDSIGSSSFRKFFIEGCSPEVFKLFLQYLYGATVEDFENLSEEMLAELITLADRYEVSFFIIFSIRL